MLSLSFSIFTTAEAQTVTVHSLDLEGPTWDNSIINVLVTPPYNESWWNPSYLSAMLHAINEWNDAISYFAANHSDFAYLSQLMIIAQVSNSTSEGFDAHTSWIDQFGNVTCEAGLSQTTYNSLNVITNASITLSAHDCLGNVLSEADEQNVALHELGHMLGLGHSNYTGDLMYYAFSLSSPVRAISTLDLYGVGTVFRWMAFSQEFDRDSQGSPIYSVTLPSDIAYEYLPVSESNLPPQSPLERIITYFSYIPDVIATPEFWLLMGFFTAAVVSIYLLGRRARRRRMGFEAAQLP